MDPRGLEGSIVALVTPFDENGQIDFPALDRLVDFHLQNHTDGILVLGTTGESSPMTDAEDYAVAERVIKDVAGRIPVIGGAGSNATHESLAKSRGLAELGVDGLLLITPYYNKSNEEGIYQHFLAVLDDVDLPVILYNIPGRTGCSISERNVARLCTHPNVMGIKEASGNISYASTVAQYLSDDFRMYSGNDDMVDVRRARDIQIGGLELVHSLFCEVNPIPVKAALAMMGMITESYRQPLWPMTDEHRARLRAALVAAGVLE